MGKRRVGKTVRKVRDTRPCSVIFRTLTFTLIEKGSLCGDWLEGVMTQFIVPKRLLWLQCWKEATEGQECKNRDQYGEVIVVIHEEEDGGTRVVVEAVKWGWIQHIVWNKGDRICRQKSPGFLTWITGKGKLPLQEMGETEFWFWTY